MESRIMPQGQEDPMSTLCRLVVETEYGNLPESAIQSAKRSILDTVAVIIGGSGMEGISEVVDLVKEKGGKPESVIPFYGGKVPASEAALAIGPMARAMDMGQVHRYAGHNSEYTLPALIAALGLKNKVSGTEFITAFVLGQEVLIRIGDAYRFWEANPIVSIGGHYIFGPVAATGKLLNLSLAQLENAEGIAFQMSQPYSMAMYADATLIVRVHHGFVCQDAINDCLMAQKGITGPRKEVLIGERGYLASARWKTDASVLTDELGAKWYMETAVTKLHSACHCTHCSVDGILQQMKEHGFEADDILKIETEQSPGNWAIVCNPKEIKWHPETVAECQFSLPYCLATAAYDKTLFLTSYTEAARARKEVRELMGRISAKEDTNLPERASRVYTTLKDGRTFSGEYLYPKGHLNNPLTDQELIEKFKRCATYSHYPLSDAQVDNVIETILNLESVDDMVEALITPLTPQ